MNDDEGFVYYTVRVNTKALVARYRRLFKKEEVKRRLIGKVAQRISEVKERILTRLRKAPPARSRWGDMIWASNRQKMKVILYLRETENIPYQRTDELTNGWNITQKTEATGAIGVLELVNTAVGQNANYDEVNYFRYVYGTYDDPTLQQPFHRQQGWPTLATEVDRIQKELTLEVKEVILEVETGKKRRGR